MCDVLESVGLYADKGPVAHPAGLCTGALPPRSADWFRRAISIDLHEDFA
jgi:hypothetical protein